MKMKPLAVAMIAALGWQGAALADGSPAGITMEERIQRMEQRLKYLENRVQSQDEVIRDKERQIAELETKGGGVGEWWQGVKMSGVVEVEAMHTDNADITAAGSPDASDINVATVELGIEAAINDWTTANVVLLWEEENPRNTNLNVDVATVTIGNAEVTPFHFTAGRMAVPFGRFETHMVSDPLTLEIGETKETVALVGFENDGFYGNAYLFNGDMDTAGDNEIDNGGLNLGYAWEGAGFNGDVGVSYINDLADSDNVTDNLTAVPVATTVNDVAAYGLHASLTSGPFSFIGEYLAASDRFAVGEMAFKGNGAKPGAWNLEAGYGFLLAGKESTFAVGYQETDEAVALGLPEERTSLGLSVAVMENTSLSFEWTHDEAYSTADGGTGQDADTLTAQLAVEF